MKDVLLACDIVALPLEACYPNLLIEVGGIGKRVAISFAEISEHALPRTVPLIVRHIRHGKWRWHLDCDTSFESLPDLLAYFRENSYSGLDRLAAEDRRVAVAVRSRKRLPRAADAARRPTGFAVQRAAERTEQ